MRNFFTSLILCGIVSIGASAQYQPLAANETTEYSGYLNISMLGMVITTDSPATIEITDNGDGTCDFLLPDLVLEDLGSLGDIELKGVTVTEDADGTYSYSGYEENMQLLGGELIANVSLTGTITADGVVNMVISVIWKISESSSLPVTVTFTSEKASGNSSTTEYSGYLNISMLGMVITTDSPATIEITDNGDGTCDFLLPDLVLEDLGSLGDIELKGVTVTEDADGTCTYSGYEENMQLLGGELIANVSLTGTITADGVVNMVISVIWKVSESSSLPVTVTFTSEKASVSSPTITPSDDEGLVDVYTITGVKVLEKVTIDQATKTLAKGLYIMGDKKILVK